jgi:hypothetical protein
MRRLFRLKPTAAVSLAYLVLLCALVVGHFVTAAPSPDPAVSIRVSRFLTPLAVLGSCLPVVLAAPLLRALWRHRGVRLLAVMSSFLLGAAWCVGLAEWLWLMQWREGKFLFMPLPSFVHEPKLPLWAIFTNAAVVSGLWTTWACGSRRTLMRNLVLSLVYVPLWQFSVFAVEEIALSGSTEVNWLLELRAVFARVGTAGLFVIGLGWVVWIVERASRRLALRKKKRQLAVTQAGATPAEERSLARVQRWLTLLSAAALCVGPFLPVAELAPPDLLGVFTVVLGLLPIVVFCLVAFLSLVVVFFWGRPVWLWAIWAAGLGMFAWMLVMAQGGVTSEDPNAGLSTFFGALGLGAYLIAGGLVLLLLAAMIPRDAARDLTGRVAWNPLDVEAWYYGRKSRKLVQSLTALAVYGMNFLAGVMFFSLIGGCEERYEMPAGGGETKQIAQQVKVQKVIKKKYVINPFSAIVFNPPPIDDVKLQLNEVTQHQYKVGYGAGEGAGFAGGTAKGRVRFIRLEYAGGDWNQDFGVGADLNMLVEYNARTSHRVADRTESRTVAQLANFPIGASPPFVYLTGQKNISLSKSEIKILREYLIDKHGMIFGDNGGSAHFHNQFFQMMNQVLPGVEAVRVPLDDPIHTRPYRIPFLPYVAPHGGKEAWGWKLDGRWVCYYHPGDIGDAWADEHAGIKPEIAEYCYQLGVNVIFYAHVEYNQWLDARKKR